MHVYAPAPSIERVIAKIHATILNCRNSMRRVLRRPCHTVRFLDCARNDRVGKSTVRRLLSFRLFAFCHFDRSIVFSLAFAQNRGFCAKEERQRSEVARRVYAACLERSLPRRARGEISERQRRTKGRANEFRCGNAAIRGRRFQRRPRKFHFNIVFCRPPKSVWRGDLAPFTRQG